MSIKPAVQRFQFGSHEVTLETGRIARQASGSVLVTVDSTVVLVTVVVAKEAAPEPSFFPLSVHYQERTYATGKIPGGFFRREGRPTEKEILTSRLIDRPLRPLFPKGFMNEVQVVCTVLSSNPDLDPDIPALLGASAALAVSGAPFNGPIGAVRVGFVGSDYVLNPSYSQLKNSQLDMVVAGTEKAVLMVESEAKELSEDMMLGAVLYAHQEMQSAIHAIKALAEAAGTTPWSYSPPAESPALTAVRDQNFDVGLTDAYQNDNKGQRNELLAAVRAEAVEALTDFSATEVRDALKTTEKELVRKRILSEQKRIDGRDNKSVRPIDVSVGLLPCAHGSALFTRGETQAIGNVTLGSMRSAQIIDALEAERKDYFMLHYNFPPYSVGETGRMGGPGRREVGHGRLARRGLAAVLPDVNDFPYTVRVVSEITESNGSSSMASVCVASMSLMDAGVPLLRPVAGVAMGLISEGEKFAVLTDILGEEDHLGDMDFKVAGTIAGITALQMDIKIEGITERIMSAALADAKEARMHILQQMEKAIARSRSQVADHAPRLDSFKVPQDKIRDIIGKGGATIRSIVDETSADIDIDDDGTVRIYAASGEQLQLAKDRIHALTDDPEIGAVYTGKVVKIMDFGAFVNFLPGRDGLVHISQIANEHIKNVSDYLSEGQTVKVKVLDIDDRNRVRLSIKAVTEAEGGEPSPHVE